MTPSSSNQSCDDILEAFSVEPDPGRETLERYLRSYPQYGAELVDLSRELSRVVIDNEESLSERDQDLIQAAWERHLKAAPATPLSNLSVDEQRQVAELLGVPRQVITAFRERKVLINTVPQKFMKKLADAVDAKVEFLIEVLSCPSSLDPLRSYKADSKPEVETAVAFEQLLIDACIPEEKRRALMMSEND